MCIKRGLITFCHRISCVKKNLPSYDFVDLDSSSIEDMKESIDDCILYGELEQKIKKLMFDLPFEIGNVLELRINSFSYLEIAKLLDIPSSTVNFRCKKVRESIKQLFDNYYNEKTI